MTSDINAAQLSLLGLKGLVRGASSKQKRNMQSRNGAEFEFKQPAGKVTEIELHDQVLSLLNDYPRAQDDVISCKARFILFGHLLTRGLEIGQHVTIGAEQEVDLVNDLKLKCIDVKWLTEDGGDEWCSAVVVSLSEENYYEVAVGDCTIKLPVYKLEYTEDDSTANVVFLSDSSLLDIDDDKEPFYDYKYQHGSRTLYDMPFDYVCSLKCKNETEIKQYVGRCMQATLQSLEVEIAQEKQVEFVCEIEDMVHRVVDGLIQFRVKVRGDPVETRGDFGLRIEGTATITADDIIQILQVNEEEDKEGYEDEEGDSDSTSLETYT